MTEERHELVLVGGGSLTTAAEPMLPNSFQAFRRVFAPERCLQRKVFWVEEKWGKTRLRQVMTTRVNKKEDKLVGLFEGPVNLDVVRLAVAGSSMGQILTGVCWELYRDFACTELIARGRFDYVDLIAGIDRDKLTVIFNKGVVGLRMSPNDWDFDGLIATHTCPTCKRLFGLDLVVFLPSGMSCQYCGFGCSLRQGRSGLEFFLTVRGLTHRVMRPIKGLHDASVPPEVREVMQLIELTATPIVCWLVAECYHGQPFGLSSMYADQGFPLELVSSLVKRSLFSRLQVGIVRQRFLELVDQYYASRRERVLHGPMPIKLRPEMTDEEYRKYLAADWEKNRVDAHADVARLAELSAWLLSRGDGLPQDKLLETSSAMARAARSFPLLIDELIQFLDEELTKEGGACV